MACAFPSWAVAFTSAGTIEAEVELPGEGIYCCGIGGADGQALFLAVGAPDESVAARKPLGRIIAVPL